MAEPLSPQLHQLMDGIISRSRFAYLQGQAREQKMQEIVTEIANLQFENYYNALSPVDHMTYHHLKRCHMLTFDTEMDWLRKHVPNMTECNRQAYRTIEQRYTK